MLHDHPSQGSKFDDFFNVSLNPLHFWNAGNLDIANIVIPPREYNYVSQDL